MPFRYEGHFWATKPNELCSDVGGSPITTENECKEARCVLKLPKPIYQNEFSTESHASFPQNCVAYERATMISMFWNKHPTGSRNSRTRQICKDAGKQSLFI